MNWKARLLSAAIFLLLAVQARAFVADTSMSPRDSLKPPKKVAWLAVPAFGYAPETRWYVGAVGLAAFKLAKDTLTRSSNAKLEVNYTQNKQLIVEGGATLFSAQEKYFISALAAYRKFPEFWWGIGNTAPDSDKELYQANRLEVDLRILRAIRGKWFAGGIYSFHSMFGITSPPGGILDAETIPGAAGGNNSGLGLAVLHDNRDNLLNPQRGFFLDLQQQFFHSALGSDFQFSKFSLDARTYIPFRKGHVLALQGKLILQGGEPPFRMLSLLGSASDMRGYYQGRYRDRDYYTVQAEYRFPLFWRLGLATFAGFGDVGRNPGDIGSSDFKYSFGGGLRILMDKAENINLRFDYAVGRQSTGFYVAFGEAF